MSTGQALIARGVWALRRRAALLMLWVAIVVASLSLGPAAHAGCATGTITIIGSVEEEQAACAALDSVLEWFREIGFDLDLVATVHCKDAVFCEFTEGADGRDVCQVQVSGLFDFSRWTVEITSADSPHRQLRQRWGIDWGPEIAFSILQHELTHLAVAGVLREGFRDLAAPWHEFIAYAVQFDVMDPALRARILDGFPGVGLFSRPESINPTIYGADPDLFALRPWFYMRENGGGDLIRAILDGEVGASASDVNYLWTD